MPAQPITYKDAGVDVDAKGRFVDSIAGHMRRTYGPRVLDRHGAFAGLFRLDDDKRFRRRWKKPLLVAGADGVGTKLLVAAAMGEWSTIGIDLVAMNVNDCLVMGAEPLFFLDYLAVPKVEPAVLERIVAGIADGCEQAGCALLGGETAEMPSLYRPGELDMAGFSVGVVEKSRIITGDTVREGDAIIGLASSGLHSNGYSLARKLFFETAGLKPSDHHDALGCTVGAELLKPTRIYCRAVLRVLRKLHRRRYGRPVHGMAHITGESFIGNIPRSLPTGLQAAITRGSWPVPPVFTELARLGGLGEADLFNTFNMGVGYVIILDAAYADAALDVLRDAGQDAWRIGTVRAGTPEVVFVD